MGRSIVHRLNRDITSTDGVISINVEKEEAPYHSIFQTEVLDVEMSVNTSVLPHTTVVEEDESLLQTPQTVQNHKKVHLLRMLDSLSRPSKLDFLMNEDTR